MGIRGLETFLESREDHNCTRHVYIAELAAEFRNQHKRTPVIVVDASSCLSRWFRCTASFSGLYMAEFIDIILKFVDAFNNAGIQLVFYFGGPTVDKKRVLWSSRRFRDVKRVESVFDMLINRTPICNIDISNILTPHLSAFAMLIIRHYTDSEVCMSIDEDDAEIMRYAYNKQCFAVLSQDSDFVIAQGNYYYLSLKHLDINRLATVAYDGKKLAEFLKVPVNRLPLLATLVGNDYIEFDHLRGFHDKIRVAGSVTIMHVAEYIKKLPTNMAEVDLLKHIAFEVFDDGNKHVLLAKSIESYSLVSDNVDDVTTTNADGWQKIISLARERHINLRHTSTIWSVVNCGLYECGASMEDFRPGRICMQPSCSSLRDLRRRLYGILLMEKFNATGEEQTVKEWVVESKYSCKSPFIVKPTYPRARHPGLLALWTDSPHVSNKVKWILFLETVYDFVPLKFHLWTQIPNRLVLVTASLRFFKATNALYDYEIYALLATVLECYLYFPKVIHTNHREYPDIRALHVSTLFFRTIILYYSIMGACGYPVPWSSGMCIFPFDGSVFQYHYHDARYKAQFGHRLFGHSPLPHFDEIVEIIFTEPEDRNARLYGRITHW